MNNSLKLALSSSVQYGAVLNYLKQNFAFWSKGNTDDYYASLGDGSPIYSLTEKI